MVYNRNRIALRYLKSSFLVDFIGCLPWDAIYRACEGKEEVRYLLWIRLSRTSRVLEFFQKLEKDIRLNYLFTRIVKLLVVELYCTHTAACIFYYLATTLPPTQEGYTWIGSLKLGDYSYSNFREIDLSKRYWTSLYYAIVTMATVGFGDIHAVNIREMIFVMFFVSFDMILGAYLIGNMTALIVKGSKTERFRDKMTDLIKYMNRNKLGNDIRNQIKGHLSLQYESSYTEGAVLQDIPVSIRAKISQKIYKPLIDKVPLFQGCSPEFINQIVIRLHEEFFLPGEVIMEQGNVVDQIYFVCHGVLEEVGIGEDGTEETVSLLERYSSFGEVSVLCNIPQPCTVQVCELCRLLRLDKQSFTNILQIYFFDGRTILTNLLEGKESNLRIKQLESDITFYIGKQEAELALRVNNAAYHGDLYQLKGLIQAGADPSKTDYDGRSPLHLAASRGYEDITFFLIQKGVDINISDKFGNSPLLEALKNGHDRVAALLVKEGASLNIDDAGSCLCKAVVRGDSDFLKRLLSNGIDPNSKDYDHRTPLHVAAAEGLYLMAKILVEAGASVFSKDRWGNTPLDEGHICGNKNLLKLLEDAKRAQLCEHSDHSQAIRDKMHPRKCTIFPFHPWDPKEKKRSGIVLWIPHTIQELIEMAAEQLKYSGASCILSEDDGRILEVDIICDGQKLYLSGENDQT
ncbi:potassium channel SKOR-like isoform X1 [Telopea speciosissima]|uniref:potassium channel SKOR-like isoform X1 n=1 Tax=Telopea speciosissima TaxID=54955 RepID=UPI001CC46CC4|nr:potassium channel SKOR-like isoform X1 [Telopea speciosissima]